MANIRNKPCDCGSGKKYKHCCLVSSPKITSRKISLELQDKLDKECWFHGTEQKFSSWEIPPPKKPNQHILTPHSVIFFTSNLAFAKGAGENIAIVSLNSKSNILDTTSNYESTEELRKAVMKSNIAAMTLNVEHNCWHEGWKSGDVLRVAFSNSKIENLLDKQTNNYINKLKITADAASELVKHNFTRSFIEMICLEAKKLGYDAIYGHEIDQHSEDEVIRAQPWLAVLRDNVVSAPRWKKVSNK